MHLLVLSAFRLCRCRFPARRRRTVSMHLLVLSAFRLKLAPSMDGRYRLNAPFGAQCFPTPDGSFLADVIDESQCTFWCSVLSDSQCGFSARAQPRRVSMHLLVLSAFRPGTGARLKGVLARLNAPFGAQCFPTRKTGLTHKQRLLVSMHLLVLSAFRRPERGNMTMFKMARLNAPFGAQCFPTIEDVVDEIGQWLSQCTFWCSVLSDTLRSRRVVGLSRSQCTFWCSVLSDLKKAAKTADKPSSQCTFWCSVLSDLLVGSLGDDPPFSVSMHLLVLSAFRRRMTYVRKISSLSLNAPFGAQCFPTRRACRSSQGWRCLNAPFGAQCFPT